MFKNRFGQVRAGWMILLAFAAVMIGQVIFQMSGSVLLVAMETAGNPDALENIDVLAALDRHPWVFLLMHGGGTASGILIIIILWRFLNKQSMKALGFIRSLNELWFGMLLGASSIVLLFILLWMTGHVELVNSFTDPELTIFTLTYLILFILVGFFEEMFFRGYVMRTMADRGNKKWVIYVISALFFSAVHGSNPNVSVIGLLNIMLIGLLFAYMFTVTKSLWMPIGYHITWNYFQGNVFGFPVSGTAPHGIYKTDISGGNDWLTGGSFGLEGGLAATFLILVIFSVIHWYARRKKIR